MAIVSSMYYLMFHGTPTFDSPDFAEFGGAFICCWIDRSSLSEAEDAARKLIADADWQIESLEESKIMSQLDYESDPTGIEYFQQAQTDGEVLVFHCYPRGDRN
jgi:hypothetical protein